MLLATGFGPFPGARAVLEAAARYVREASSRRDDVPLLRSSAAT